MVESRKLSVEFFHNDLQKPLGNERPIDVATLAGSTGAESKREATPAPASATLSRKSLTPSVKVVWGVDIRDCLLNICLWVIPPFFLQFFHCGGKGTDSIEVPEVNQELLPTDNEHW